MGVITAKMGVIRGHHSSHDFLGGWQLGPTLPYSMCASMTSKSQPMQANCTAVQWRKREFKVGGRSAEGGGVSGAGVPLPTGNTPSLPERSLGGGQIFFCFVNSKWRILVN